MSLFSAVTARLRPTQDLLALAEIRDAVVTASNKAEQKTVLALSTSVSGEVYPEAWR